MVITVHMVTTVTNRLKMAHEKHIDEVGTAGASVVWYSGIFLGFVAVLAGIIWILIINGKIVWSNSLMWALIVIVGGIGLVVFSFWMKKVILASMY